MIDTRQKLEGWDSGVITRLVAELKRGQERNIDLMIAVYQDCPDSTAISPQAAAKLGTVAVHKSQPIDNQSDVILQQPVAKLRQRFNLATSGGEIRS
jgi:hypothetical protein